MTEPLDHAVDFVGVGIALNWVAALREHRLEDVWDITDEDCRLGYTQWWMGHNPVVVGPFSCGMRGTSC